MANLCISSLPQMFVKLSFFDGDLMVRGFDGVDDVSYEGLFEWLFWEDECHVYRSSMYTL